MVTKKPPPGGNEGDKNQPKAKQQDAGQQQEADHDKQSESSPSSPSRKRHKHKHHHSHKRHHHTRKHHDQQDQQKDLGDSSLPSKNAKPPPPSPQQADEPLHYTETPIEQAGHKVGDKRAVSADAGDVALQEVNTQKDSNASELLSSSNPTPPSHPHDGVEKGANDESKQSEEDNDNDSKPHALLPVQRRQQEEEPNYDDNDYRHGDGDGDEHDNSEDIDDTDHTFDVEHLIRLETSRQLEAAWSAQRRLVGAFISKIRHDKSQLVDQQ